MGVSCVCHDRAGIDRRCAGASAFVRQRHRVADLHAFLFSRAFTQTGLGKRIGYLFIRGSRARRSAWATRWPPLTWCWRPSSLRYRRGGGVIYPSHEAWLSISAPSRADDALDGRISDSGLLPHHLCGLAMFSPHGRQSSHCRFRPPVCSRRADLGALAEGAIVPLLTLTIVPWLLKRWCRPAIRDTAPARALPPRSWRGWARFAPREVAGGNHAGGDGRMVTYLARIPKRSSRWLAFRDSAGSGAGLGRSARRKKAWTR